MLEKGDNGIFKERFYFEINRQDRLKSNLSIPLSLLVLVFGIIVFYLKHLYLFIKIDLVSIFFYMTLSISIFLVLFVIYYLIKSFYNYKYSYLPEPREMKKYIDDLGRYYQKNGNNMSEFENEVKEQMESWYLEGAQKNMLNNDER